MGAAETEWERPAPLFSILWKRAGNRRLPQRRNLLEFGQISQHFGTVLCRVHVEIGFANDTVRIDEKRVARGKFRDPQIHQRIVAGGHLMFRIREQLEAETFLGAKLLVRSLILHADSEDDGVQDEAPHQKLCAKEGLSFQLLADTKHQVSASYDSLVNLGVAKLSARHTFLIDPNGVVRKAYLN